MQSSNIHDNLSKLQKDYSEIIKSPEKESILLEGIFSELLKNPDLTMEEKNLVDRLCEDVGNLGFYCHKKLTLAFQMYQEQVLKTNAQGVLLLTNTPSYPDFSLMSNKDILKHFNLNESIKKEGARDILCNYIKDLAGPNLSPSPLNFSDLKLGMLPRCFLTDPFFANMHINTSGKISLPSDMKISEMRNLHVYRQAILNGENLAQKALQTENIFGIIGDYSKPVDRSRMLSVNKSTTAHNEYKRFKEDEQMLEYAKRRRYLPEDLNISSLSRKECVKMTDKIDQENLSLLVNLQKAGNVERLKDLNIEALSPLERQKKVQEFYDESLLKAFSHILKMLPPDIKRLWRGGDRNNVSEIRNFLHTNKASLSTITVFRLSLIFLNCIPPEIKLFTALTELTLREGKISDLSLLANLTTLQKLNLGNNQISDLSPLANLTALQELHLGNNRISDLSPLANLTALGDLGLSYNQISDLSHFLEQNHPDLLYLYILEQNTQDLNKFLPELTKKYPQAYIS